MSSQRGAKNSSSHAHPSAKDSSKRKHSLQISSTATTAMEPYASHESRVLSVEPAIQDTGIPKFVSTAHQRSSLAPLRSSLKASGQQRVHSRFFYCALICDFRIPSPEICGRDTGRILQPLRVCSAERFALFLSACQLRQSRQVSKGIASRRVSMPGIEHFVDAPVG